MMIIIDKEVLRFFFEKEIYKRVTEVLKELKKEKKIRDYLALKPIDFAKRKWGIDFYFVYVNKTKYVGKCISIVKNRSLDFNHKNFVKIYSGDSKEKIKRKILGEIKK